MILDGYDGWVLNDLYFVQFKINDFFSDFEDFIISQVKHLQKDPSNQTLKELAKEFEFSFQAIEKLLKKGYPKGENAIAEGRI
jgi:hypothetical protein